MHHTYIGVAYNAGNCSYMCALRLLVGVICVYMIEKKFDASAWPTTSSTNQTDTL